MKSHKRRRFSTPQIITLTVIIISMVIVVTATICSIVFKPEKVVKAKISKISADYYENFLYQSFDFDHASSEDYENFIQRYEKTGLSTTTLRQLLLHDHQKNADIAPLLKKYCDEDTTFIRFYPEYPYSKTSYRVEYSYSCDF